MRLCEEYLLKNSLRPNHARHVGKGFLYFEGGSKLLAIEWVSPLPHPGYYEISECVLNHRCHKLKSVRVDWDEYESHLLSWLSPERSLVFDRSEVFDLTWQYFLRRHEDVLLEALPISSIYKTVDEKNATRPVDCLDLVERIESSKPEVSAFWKNRAFDVVSLYCYWMRDLL